MTIDAAGLFASISGIPDPVDRLRPEDEFHEQS